MVPADAVIARLDNATGGVKVSQFLQATGFRASRFTVGKSICLRLLQCTGQAFESISLLRRQNIDAQSRKTR
jgi:hypothetical protein